MFRCVTSYDISVINVLEMHIEYSLYQKKVTLFHFVVPTYYCSNSVVFALFAFAGVWTAPFCLDFRHVCAYTG